MSKVTSTELNSFIKNTVITDDNQEEHIDTLMSLLSSCEEDINSYSVITNFLLSQDLNRWFYNKNLTRPSEKHIELMRLFIKKAGNWDAIYWQKDLLTSKFNNNLRFDYIIQEVIIRALGKEKIPALWICRGPCDDENSIIFESDHGINIEITNSSVLKAFLDCGADPNISYKNQPLISFSSSPKKFKLLIDAGANPLDKSRAFKEHEIFLWEMLQVLSHPYREENIDVIIDYISTALSQYDQEYIEKVLQKPLLYLNTEYWKYCANDQSLMNTDEILPVVNRWLGRPDDARLENVVIDGREIPWPLLATKIVLKDWDNAAQTPSMSRLVKLLKQDDGSELYDWVRAAIVLSPLQRKRGLKKELYTFDCDEKMVKILTALLEEKSLKSCVGLLHNLLLSHDFEMNDSHPLNQWLKNESIQKVLVEQVNDMDVTTVKRLCNAILLAKNTKKNIKHLFVAVLNKEELLMDLISRNDSKTIAKIKESFIDFYSNDKVSPEGITRRIVEGWFGVSEKHNDIIALFNKWDLNKALFNDAESLNGNSKPRI